MTDADETFVQPLATPVIVTIIRDRNDFPPVVQPIADGLLNLNSGSDSIPPEALSIAYEASRGVQHILLKESLIPRLGRDPTTFVLAPLAGRIIKSAAPSTLTFFEPKYARALYPCHRFDSALRVLPNYGTVSSAVCMSISVEGNDPATPVDDQAPSCSIGSSASSDSGEPPVKNVEQTLRAHFLEPRRSDGDIPFPLLLTATYQEIYSVMTSAVLHRHVYRDYTPCIGIAFDPQECEILLVFAWLDVNEDHECMQVHIAHAPPTKGALHECGVFDISEPDSARSFATYLLNILPSLIEVYDSAVSNLEKTRNIMTSSTGLWRLDQALDINCKEESDNSTIDQWLVDIRPATPDGPPPFSDIAESTTTDAFEISKEEIIRAKIRRLEEELERTDPFMYRVMQAEESKGLYGYETSLILRRRRPYIEALEFKVGKETSGGIIGL